MPTPRQMGPDTVDVLWPQTAWEGVVTSGDQGCCHRRCSGENSTQQVFAKLQGKVTPIQELTRQTRR